jgi:hypothetical protein
MRADVNETKAVTCRTINCEKSSLQVKDKNRVSTTKISATKDDDDCSVNLESLSYECECGRTSKPSFWWRTFVWCEHALATLQKVQDTKWGTRDAEATFSEVKTVQGRRK